MSRSPSAKPVESARIHPYSRRASSSPQNNALQPTPSWTPVLAIRGRRSPVNGQSSSKQLSSPKTHRTSEMSSSNLSSSHDDGMSNLPMQSIEAVSSIETAHVEASNIERQGTPNPQSPPCPILPNINQGANGERYLAAMTQRLVMDQVAPHPIGRILPPPNNFMAHDDISKEQLRRLDLGPVRQVKLDDIASPRTEAQVQALIHPRVCISPEGETVNRFVTDCDVTSGRVYDRLFRRELHRISPFISSFHNARSGQVFDVLHGDIRKRRLFDDLRDANARSDGILEVTEEEANIKYDAVQDYRFD